MVGTTKYFNVSMLFRDINVQDMIEFNCIIISSCAGIKMNSETVSDSVTVTNNGQSESKAASGLVRATHLLHLNPSFDSIQLLTGFEDNSSFLWPEDGSVARSRRLRSFRGSNKTADVQEASLKLFCYTPSFSNKIYSLFPLTYIH